jgi:hypothetical protein
MTAKWAIRAVALCCFAFVACSGRGKQSRDTPLPPGVAPSDLVNAVAPASFARSSPIVGRFLQPTPSPGEAGTSKLAQRYLLAGAL